MANELDQVYFKNHIHRNLRASDDALGEASAHGLSLASNVQIGTTGAALKIFKLDSTGNLTTSNNFVFKGTSGATSNTVTVRGQLTVESGNGLVVNSQSGITVTSSNTGSVFLRLQRPSNSKDGFVYFTPSGGVLSASNPEFRVGMASGTTGLYINIYDGTTSTNMLTMTSAGLVNITSGVTISGNLSVSGTSTLRGNVTTTGTLQVGGDTTITGNLNVTGTSIFSGAATFRSGVTISGLTSINTLTTTGAVNANSLNVSGNTTITGNLSVSGTSTLRGNTDILGNLTLTGTLSTPSYTLSNGSGGGNTWASFNKRIYSSALAVSSDPFDQTNGAPWYGLGLSTGSFPNTANAYVQLAGFFGVLIKAGGGSSVALQSDGKVGINTTAPASGLDVASDTVFRSGVTVSGILQFNEYTNFVPTANVYLGYWSNTAAGTVGTWYKIASFTAPSGTYRASSFMGSVLLANTNWGDNTPTEHFFEGNIQYYNGSAVLVDSGTLKTSASFPSGLLQLVKTGTAAWELQLGLYSQNKTISWKIEPISGYSPTYFDRAAAGTALTTGTVTETFDSRIGQASGTSLDLASTLNVDGVASINNQLLVSTTNNLTSYFKRTGATSTGGIILYHYLDDDATTYLQDTSMLYTDSLQTGGLLYASANSSATHRFHVGGFNSTASEKMQINSQGVRISFIGNQSGAGAAVSDELQVGGATFISGLTTIFTQGESLKLAGTNASYFGFYPTGATSASTAGREGYIGFANGTNRDLYIFNASTTGSVRIVGSSTTGSAVRVFFSGATQSWSVENDGVLLVGDGFNTGGSVWSSSGAQMIIGGSSGTKFNAGTAGGGTGVKLLIHGHDNDGSDIYPLYIEDENSNADFWVRGRKLTAPTRNTTVYIGGDLGIGTSAPGAALDVNSSAIIRGGLTISGSLGVSGTTTSVFTTANAASSAGSSNLWFELGTITLTTQYQQESVRLELTNDGGSGAEDQSLTTSILFRVKQQNPMLGNSPFVDVLVPYAMGRIAADDIIAVATQNDSSAKVVKLHAKLRTNYDNFKFTVLNNDIGNFTVTKNATGTVSLPTGTQYTGIAGFYADSTGRVGINTSSPAAGLDVNSDSVFRSGVTISGNTTIGPGYLYVSGGLSYLYGGIVASGATPSFYGPDPGVTFVLRSSGINYGIDVTSTDNKFKFFNPAGPVAFEVGATEKMRITTAGFVGIGTSSPASGLDVNSDAVFRSGVTITGSLGVSGNYIWNPGTNFSANATANNQEWSVDLNNNATYTGGYWHVWSDKVGGGTVLAVRGDTLNVGIRTNTPASGLDVNGDAVFRSGVTITGNTQISGSSTVRGNSNILGALQVSGDTIITGNFNVSGTYPQYYSSVLTWNGSIPIATYTTGTWGEVGVVTNSSWPSGITTASRKVRSSYFGSVNLGGTGFVGDIDFRFVWYYYVSSTYTPFATGSIFKAIGNLPNVRVPVSFQEYQTVTGSYSVRLQYLASSGSVASAGSITGSIALETL